MKDEDYKGPSEESQNIAKTLFCRKIDGEKMMFACDAVIDLLRKKLKLEPWECFFVVENLYKTFPREDLLSSRKTISEGT